MNYKNFIGGAYTLSDKKASNQECINWYVENDTLQPTGGYEDLIDFEVDGNIRAVYRTTRGLGLTGRNPLGDIIVVCGSNVIWYNPITNTSTTLGVITNILKVITIVDDGIGIVLADGEQLYRINMDTLDFSIINLDGDDETEAIPIKPRQVAVLNYRTIMIGYTADDTGEISNKFYYSDIADNSQFNSQQYFELADIKSPITAIKVSNNLLYLYTYTQYQIWQTNGNNIRKPFTKRTTGTDDIGLYAIDSVSELGGSQFFVGSLDQGTPGIYADGKIISTPAINKEIANTDSIYATSFTFSERGHNFVVFQFPSIEKTYVFDISNGEWHRRAYRNDLGTLSRWQPMFSVSYGGKIIVGSIDESKLYEYSIDILTQSDSGEILRLRIGPNLINESRNIQYDRISFDAKVGEGVTNDVSAPELMFRYSQDGGYSWSSRLSENLGRRGDYDKEIEFRGLGRSKQFCAELSISDASATIIHSASVFNNVSTSRG